MLQHHYASNVWWRTMKSTRIAVVLRPDWTQANSHVLTTHMG